VTTVRQKAVFLDRDGTLIEDAAYAARPEQIRILGGTARGLERLAAAGYRLVVVTNQSGIARGRMTEDDLARFHEALDVQLGLLGVHVDAYYACPHHPDPSQVARPELAVDCECRKPKPGMILQAAEDLTLDLTASWTVGDAWRDVAAGQAAGVRTIKVPSSPGPETARPPEGRPPDAEVANLDEAADVILGTTAKADAPSPPPAPSPKPSPDAPLPPTDHLLGPGTEVAEVSPEEKPTADAAPIRAAAKSTAPAVPVAGAEKSPTPSPKPAAAKADEGLLREVLTELRRLARSRHAPSLSFVRLLAYVLQAAALFSAVVMPLVIDWKMPGQDKMMYLQIAILLQLMVVTLLLLERKP